jgi:transcriptional regulator of met regulon
MNMARRKIATLGTALVQVRVYRDSEYDEWVCRLYTLECTGWTLNADADYFTDSKEDALGTAAQMVTDWNKGQR